MVIRQRIVNTIISERSGGPSTTLGNLAWGSEFGAGSPWHPVGTGSFNMPNLSISASGLRVIGSTALSNISTSYTGPTNATTEKFPIWFNTSWSNRIKITIDHTKVPSNQTNFPVYINLADLPASFFSTVKSDGSDIVVTDSTQVGKQPRELVYISTSNKTGELWFLAPTLSSSTDTVFYIYYGNSSTSETNNPKVWGPSYRGVWHLNDTSYPDSTENLNNGTNSFTSITGGQIGSAAFFSGNSFIQPNNQPALDITGAMTISTWVNRGTNSPIEAAIFAKDSGVSQSAKQYALTYEDQLAGVNWRIANSAGSFYDTNTTLPASTNTYIAGTFTGSILRLYKNGIETGSAIFSGTQATTTSNAYIGNRDQANAIPWRGIIDETRVLNIALGSDWLMTEYNNQNSSSTFYSSSLETLANTTTGTQVFDASAVYSNPRTAGSITTLQYAVGSILAAKDSWVDTVALCPTDTNHNATNLQISSVEGLTKDTYVGFDVSGFKSGTSNSIESAILYLNVVTPSILATTVNLFTISAGSENWDETTIKCSTRPAADATDNSQDIGTTTGEKAIPLGNVAMNYLKARFGVGTFTLLLQQATAASTCVFQSKDSGGTPGNSSGPKLKITFRTI